MSVSTFEEITKTKPEKSLTVKLQKHAGRNNQGKITTRHRGGGAKRAYRIIDFKRNKLNVPARVAAIEYDPNRSARIALLHYLDGEKRYIIAPLGLKVGDHVSAGPDADIRPGNALPLKNIPTGTTVHCIELERGRGAQMARGAGVGTALLRAVVDSSEAAGVWTLQTGIFPENAASVALHEKAGFRVVGRRERVGRHHGVWRDVLFLERRSPVVD